VRANHLHLAILESTPEVRVLPSAAGVRPVIVPDNDPGHRGSVYDDEEQGELFTE
jgi:hypothetical protein